MSLVMAASKHPWLEHDGSVLFVRTMICVQLVTWMMFMIASMNFYVLTNREEMGGFIYLFSPPPPPPTLFAFLNHSLSLVLHSFIPLLLHSLWSPAFPSVPCILSTSLSLSPFALPPPLFLQLYLPTILLIPYFSLHPFLHPSLSSFVPFFFPSFLYIKT